jgi:hypothetical protein
MIRIFQHKEAFRLTGRSNKVAVLERDRRTSGGTA